MWMIQSSLASTCRGDEGLAVVGVRSVMIGNVRAASRLRDIQMLALGVSQRTTAPEPLASRLYAETARMANREVAR